MSLSSVPRLAYLLKSDYFYFLLHFFFFIFLVLSFKRDQLNNRANNYVF
jgi:hypothetical protein